MFTQKMPLLKRLIIGCVLSSVLFGFGGFIANTPAAHAQPAAKSVQQPIASTFMKEHSYAPPPKDQYRYDKHTHQWYRYDTKTHSWRRYDRVHNRYF
ncbi:MAG TPA: hypothetical protein VGN34_12905 [Ktedonobacteraceae bacterium]